jgi:hypothetical protein
MESTNLRQTWGNCVCMVLRRPIICLCVQGSQGQGREDECAAHATLAPEGSAGLAVGMDGDSTAPRQTAGGFPLLLNMERAVATALAMGTARQQACPLSFAYQLRLEWLA